MGDDTQTISKMGKPAAPASNDWDLDIDDDDDDEDGEEEDMFNQADDDEDLISQMIQQPSASSLKLNPPKKDLKRPTVKRSSSRSSTGSGLKLGPAKQKSLDDLFDDLMKSGPA